MYRIGLGEDSHRTEPGGPLRLGGIDIPHDQQLVGHSDADVVLHAITDALLGSASLPDIGQMFPNTAAENRGRDSADMLRRAYAEVQQAGYRLVNLDCVVRAERPKLGPLKEEMRQRIASILGVTPDSIGLKAKTGEGVGTVGRGEAVAATAVAMVVRSDA